MSNLKGKRVLIVDDEPLLCETLALFFNINGAETEVATGGDSAFELLKKSHFDVVLTDLQMANGDGLSLIEKINSTISPKPMLFLCSGLSEIKDLDLKKVAVAGFFEKPFSPKLMLAEIERAIVTLQSNSI